MYITNKKNLQIFFGHFGVFREIMRNRFLIRIQNDERKFFVTIFFSTKISQNFEIWFSLVNPLGKFLKKYRPKKISLKKYFSHHLGIRSGNDSAGPLVTLFLGTWLPNSLLVIYTGT